MPFGIPGTNESSTLIGRICKNENEDASSNTLFLVNADLENPNGVYRINVNIEDVKQKLCLYEG